MNYLTNYYKNLSEQLSHRVKLLENYLYEMDTQISAADPIQFSDTEVDSAAVAPPSSTPANKSEPGAPQDPGREPVKRDGESDKDFGYRYGEWLKAKKRFDVYQKLRNQGTNFKIFNFPKRMPFEKVGDELRAVPPAKPGDYYISQNGDVFYVDGNGVWQRQ